MSALSHKWCHALGLWLRRCAVVFCMCVTLGAVAAEAASPARPRVVSLAPSMTELAFALGVGEQVVGVTAQCDFPPEVRTLPKVGTFLAPNVEAVLALQPQLVLATPSPGNRRVVERLLHLGLRVLVVDPQSVAALAEVIRMVAAELGVPDRGQELSQRFSASIEEVRRRVARAQPRRVLFVVGRNPLIAVGHETIQDETIRLAGGVNVVTAHGWPKVSMEFVLREAPDVVIDATMGTESTSDATAVAFWQWFSSVAATNNRRIVFFADDRVLRPGPRLPDGLRALARVIHPELFAHHDETSEESDAR